MNIKEIKQDLFNKAYIGLANQNEWSVNSDGDCLYRGDKGLKCPVGWCIPDEDYSGDHEGLKVSQSDYLSSVFKRVYSIFDEDFEDVAYFLDGMQLIGHDKHAMDLEGFTLKPLKKFGLNEGLTIPEIKENN